MTPGNTIHAIASSVSMKLVSSAESDADHGRGSTIEFGGHGSSTNTYAATGQIVAMKDGATADLDRSELQFMTLQQVQ